MYKETAESDKDFLNIDILALTKILFKERLKIFLVTLLFAIFSVFYSLSLKNQYISYSILLPNTEGSSVSSLARQYSGLASIAGIDISSPGSALSSVELADEQLKQLTFFENYIYDEILVELIAGDRWDKSNNKLIIDEEIYDSETNSWIRDVKWPLTTKPSSQEAHIVFMRHLTTEYDTKTSKLTIYVEHFHPETAKRWLEVIIQGLKNDNKARSISTAEKSIAFFEREYQKTQITELKKIISNLLGDSIQKLAVSSIEGDNLFIVIQEPFVPLIKDSPTRSIICVLITIFGFILSCLYFLIQDFVRSKNLTIEKLLNRLR